MAIIGGLNDVGDVKILVLYILQYAGKPLTKENLIDIALEAGSVSYFDMAQAIEELLLTGPIDIINHDNPDTVRITELGKQTLSLFEKNLPYSVRRKNQSALVKILADIKYKQSVTSDIVKKGMGYEVTCTLYDGEDILLSYKLLVPTQIQAQMIADQFEKDPTSKYKSILDQLIDEKLFED
ncbi:MAG: DUF4364 family protein [Clostridia bacterium]|nr:DUF4364 family protein [Clostridia bacterium]